MTYYCEKYDYAQITLEEIFLKQIIVHIRSLTYHVGLLLRGPVKIVLQCHIKVVMLKFIFLTPEM